jgi:uncharacterized membrane protein YqaE (UPF0057 family)
MKALRYFFCIVFPPVAIFLTGRMGSLLLSIILTLSCVGTIPAMIHAILVVNDFEAEKRAERIAARLRP